MDLSINTDFNGNDPYRNLKLMANAGFSHTHWCHQWDTDFLYGTDEIEQIRKWLREFGLKLLEVHGCVGPQRRWASFNEDQRKGGVELVKNRIDMTARLGADVLVMHVNSKWSSDDSLRKSLDELQNFSRERGVRIAIENGEFCGLSMMEDIQKWLLDYDPGYLGLCYDTGHGNIKYGLDDHLRLQRDRGDRFGLNPPFADTPKALDYLEVLKDRLISVHLHDNKGGEDEHNLLFSGTIDWSRIARIMAGSSYAKCANLELGTGNSGIEGEVEFIERAFETGKQFSQMINQQRKIHGSHKNAVKDLTA